MLHKWVVGLRFGKSLLFAVCKVQIIYREDQSGEIVWRRRQGFGERGDLPCLSDGALSTVFLLMETCDCAERGLSDLLHTNVVLPAP